MTFEGYYPYTNELGETFSPGEMACFYKISAYKSPALYKSAVGSGAIPGHIKGNSTGFAKNPGSALIMLDEYYKLYGYPD
jgi:hypothetical protein